MCAFEALTGREQVSSSNAIVFLSKSKMTRYGFEPLPINTIMSLGNVVPLIWKEDRSENTCVPPVA